MINYKDYKDIKNIKDYLNNYYNFTMHYLIRHCLLQG